MNNKNERISKLFLLLLVMGLLLRLSLSLQNYRGDMNNYFSWGKDIERNGMTGFYERKFQRQYHTLDPNYPPLSNNIFYISEIVYESTKKATFWLNTHVPIFPSNLVYFFDNPYVMPAFYKLPAILADIGIAWIIYLFTKRNVKSKKSILPLIAGSFILFNPAFFYNSSYWGQIESIPLFFVLASFYSLLFSRNKMITGIFFALSLLAKQTSIIFIPILMLVYIKKYSAADFLKQFIIPLILLFIIFFLPFQSHKLDFTYPFITYWSKIVTVSGQEYVTNHAFNYWYIVTKGASILDTFEFMWHLSYRMWGYLIIGAVTLILLYRIIKQSLKQEIIITAAFLISFSVFLFMTKMHERHLEQALPFLLLLGINNKKILIMFSYLSIFHFLNLYDNWWSPALPFIQTILKQTYFIQTLIVVSLGIFLLLFLDPFFNKQTKINS